jgi:hypothetical protein
MNLPCFIIDYRFYIGGREVYYSSKSLLVYYQLFDFFSLKFMHFSYS